MAGSDDSGELRARAEASLSRKLRAGKEPEEVNVEEALHELRVHQVELEMQNDELMRAHSELETARDRYFDLYELAPVGYVTLDPDGRILAVNRSACALLGKDRADLLGRALSAFLFATDIGAFTFHLRAAFEWRERRVAELQFAGNGVRSLRLESVRARQAGGDLVCHTTLVDVTEQREAEQRLAAREERLSAILDTAVDAIVVCEPSGKITLANRAAEAMFDRPERPILGRGVGDLLAPGARAEMEAGLAEHGHGGHSALIGTVRQVEAIRADGTAFAAEVAVGARTGEGGFVLFIRDVSERARYEEELRRAQKLEAVGRLASGVAHDFNNLLMSISGAAELALLALELEPGASAARPYLDEIRQEVVAAAGVVRQLLRVGRGGDEEPGADVDAAVAGAAAILRRMLGEEIDLRLDLGAAGAAVPISAAQLQQIILNLATNARDAMPEGGELRIATAVVTVEANAGAPALAAGAYARVAVTDTGAGMAPETRAHAFEPFFSTKQQGEGTGLGLWNIFQVVREHRGHIAIDSRIGAGTAVVIHLPCEAAGRAAVTPEASSSVAAGAGRTVLLVEDDDRVRRSLQSYLDGGGYRIVALGDPDEAISLLRSLPGARGGQAEAEARAGRQEPAGPQEIDVLLTDMALPRRSGRAVADVAREVGVPAAFISAHAGATLRESGHLPAGAPFLQKPFSRERLLGWLGGVLAGRPGGAAVARAAAVGGGAGARIVLVVEDQEDLRETLRELLEMRGYEVVVAGTGEEALAIAEGRGQLDVALADISLPDIGGARLAGELRRRRPGLPIVYMSGFLAEDPDVAKALAASRTAFVQKPAPVDTIDARIQSLLAGHE